MDRFSISLPVLLKVISGHVEQRAQELSTRNMSAGGAFLFTPSPLPLGSKVDIEFDLPTEFFGKTEGKNPRVFVTGEVIRRESSGMAVSFDDKYRIARLSAH